MLWVVSRHVADTLKACCGQFEVMMHTLMLQIVWSEGISWAFWRHVGNRVKASCRHFEGLLQIIWKHAVGMLLLFRGHVVEMLRAYHRHAVRICFRFIRLACFIHTIGMFMMFVSIHCKWLLLRSLGISWNIAGMFDSVKACYRHFKGSLWADWIHGAYCIV